MPNGAPNPLRNYAFYNFQTNQWLSSPSATSQGIRILTPGGPGDVNDDDVVNVNDLLTLVGAWGTCAAPCPADLNRDGVVDTNDLLIVIENWD